MNIEIPKLEIKLAEMREELRVIRPLLASNRTLLGRSVTLCEHICQCEQMLANARVLDFQPPANKRRITSYRQTHSAGALSSRS